MLEESREYKVMEVRRSSRRRMMRKMMVNRSGKRIRRNSTMIQYAIKWRNPFLTIHSHTSI